ncbi:hypothetical protein NQU36_30105, partial [Escherichia coli]|uniref:hypothetical protein n=1 Tax=Escherichia coli TaxID=562 RepID=UPI002117A98E
MNLGSLCAQQAKVSNRVPDIGRRLRRSDGDISGGTRLDAAIAAAATDMRAKERPALRVPIPADVTRIAAE